jgi:aromatic-L-amino-acid decarboxylase
MTQREGKDMDLARLFDLRSRAAALDPQTEDRLALLQLATEHAERHLEGLRAGPALVPAHGVARSLTEYGIPQLGRDAADVLDVVRRLVETPGAATTSPRYFGYIPAGGLFHAAIGDLLAAVSNRYAGQAAISPGAAGLEHVVVRWLAQTVGMGARASGVLTSGGSSGALVAIVTARDAADVLNPTAPRPVVYLGDQVHHSIRTGLRVAGLGHAIVRRLPLDEHHRVRVDGLARTVAEDRLAGLRPFLLVGTAGTTSTGSVDPLADMAGLARREDLWFHVDGAYGGLFVLAPEARHVLEGLELADSVIVDPHKTLFLPYGIGAVLMRDPSSLEASFAATADYLAARPEDEPASPADLGPELTRHFRALRLWLPLQLAGQAAFSAALSEKLLLARYAHRRLAGAPGIATGPGPDLSIVTFRVAGSDSEHATARLVDEVQREGEVFLTTARGNGELLARIAIGSFRTHLHEVDDAVNAVLRALPKVSGDGHGHRADGGEVGRVSATAAGPGDLGPLRLEFRPGSPDPDVRDCEAAVFGHRYGNTAEELRDAYAEHDGATACLAVRDPSGRVLGWVRLVTSEGPPLKTVRDAAAPPWNLDLEAAAGEVGIDIRRTWDVATIGVRPELGAQGSRIAAALYHGIIRATAANDAGWVIAMIDVRVKALLRRLGFVMHTFPGASPQPYMGSSATVPAYANMEQVVQEQRRHDPENYVAISLGVGLDGIQLPPEWSFVLPLHEVDLRGAETRTA